MAVIINEFEVMPERTDASQATPQGEASQPPVPALTTSELEQVMRQLRERLDRVRAH